MSKDVPNKMNTQVLGFYTGPTDFKVQALCITYITPAMLNHITKGFLFIKNYSPPKSSWYTCISFSKTWKMNFLRRQYYKFLLWEKGSPQLWGGFYSSISVYLSIHLNVPEVGGAYQQYPWVQACRKGWPLWVVTKILLCCRCLPRYHPRTSRWRHLWGHFPLLRMGW